MKKREKRLMAMTPCEVFSLSQILKKFDVTNKTAIPNLNGTFSHIDIKRFNPLDSQSVGLIKKHFRKSFNNVLQYEERKDNELYVGTFSVLCN